MEADHATRELLVNEVVPYLRLHCNLSEMEQAAKSALHNAASLTPIDAAYFTAITEYVAECRAMLNSGSYELPEAPKHSDFDPELQAYKEQVKTEVEKETPTVDALEAKVNAGETISLVDLANAIKAEQKGGKGKLREEKQSIRAQLKKDAGKEKAAPKKAASKNKNNDLEV